MKATTLLYFAIAVVVIFLLMLYYTLRTKKTDVKNQSPYKEILGQSHTLKRGVTLAKNLDEFYLEQLYFITEDQELFEGVQKVATLPKGTKITLQTAIHHTNGTSGITTSNIVGAVYVNELKATVNFEYRWGKKHTICLVDPCGYWTFPISVWQDTEDTKKYFME